MTEEQTGGTTPETEAIAPVDDQASEEAAGVPIADEPADMIAAATTETSEPPAPAVLDPEPASPADAMSEAIEPAPAALETVTVSEAEVADAPAAEEPEEEPEAPAAPVVQRPEPSTMEELLAEQDADIKSFKHGDVVEGTVVRIDRDEILVDIGAKSEGVVSNRELYGRHAESAPQLAVGDVVLVYVLQPESQEGHVVLSLRRAGLERKWRSMQEQFEAGAIIDAPVIDHNKGGL
ncbi:MAG: S1 RNA-binding domain-containing protein, partial [Gaiellaceae bacterium]